MNTIRHQRKPISAASALDLNSSLSTRSDEPPCTLEPALPRLLLDDVCDNRIDSLRELLMQHGAVLLRGFSVGGPKSFHTFIQRLAQRASRYREPATPRSHVYGEIYTSTEYPADQLIPLHNENSHCISWPMTLAFYCQCPAETFGATPIANCYGALQRISVTTLRKFEKRKIRYTRRFGGGLGFSWQKVFGVNSEEEVEAYCHENEMKANWSGDRLTITYVRDAVRHHPLTGKPVWFNHGLFFNPVSLPESTRLELQKQNAIDALPYDTSYGDGTPFEASVLQEISCAYAAETRIFSWRKNDVLVLDNMLFAHGRQRYTGERKVLVGMCDENTSLVIDKKTFD